MLASTRYSINKITQSLQQRFIVFIHQYHYSATRLLIGTTNNIADYHIVWADQLKADNQITRENVTQVVQKAVGAVFARVLEDAGVFKRDVEGQEGFMRFIKTL